MAPQARVSQEVIESLLFSTFRNSRVSQDVIEALISSVVIPAQTRVSQLAIEILVENIPVTPVVVTSRYGPRLHAM